MLSYLHRRDDARSAKDPQLQRRFFHSWPCSSFALTIFRAKYRWTVRSYPSAHPPVCYSSSSTSARYPISDQQMKLEKGIKFTLPFGTCSRRSGLERFRQNASSDVEARVCGSNGFCTFDRERIFTLVFLVWLGPISICRVALQQTPLVQYQVFGSLEELAFVLPLHCGEVQDGKIDLKSKTWVYFAQLCKQKLCGQTKWRSMNHYRTVQSKFNSLGLFSVQHSIIERLSGESKGLSFIHNLANPINLKFVACILVGIYNTWTRQYLDDTFEVHIDELGFVLKDDSISIAVECFRGVKKGYV